MKAYTDLKQSKKLAEILPIESADETWIRVAFAEDNLDVPEEMEYKHSDIPFKYYSGIGIPCWSLVALINIINNDYYTNIFHDGAAWNINIIHHDTGNKHTTYGNSLIDICYKIILKLY